MTAKPSYVRRGGLDNQPPPWNCTSTADGRRRGISAHVFVMSATTNALQQLCDRCLNQPSGGRLRYQPYASFVSLTFQHFDQLFSESPDCDQQATHTYNEASFWVPVENTNGDKGLELFCPYMFIDNGMALSAGRETFGYPKEMATLSLNTGAGDYTVNAPAVRRFGPGQPSIPTEIIRCSTTGAPSMTTHPEFDLATLHQSVLSWIGGPTLDLVFLREFRAIDGGRGSDLKEVTCASADPFTPRSISGFSFKYWLTLADVESHPIAADLGLTVTAAGQVDVLVAVHCEADAIFQAGRRIAPP